MPAIPLCLLRKLLLSVNEKYLNAKYLGNHPIEREFPKRGRRGIKKYFDTHSKSYTLIPCQLTPRWLVAPLTCTAPMPAHKQQATRKMTKIQLAPSLSFSLFDKRTNTNPVIAVSNTITTPSPNSNTL